MRRNQVLKILVYSVEGNGVFVTNRLQKEGHDVTLFINKKEVIEYMEGLVKKIDNIEDIDPDTDVVFVDDVGCGKEIDKLIKEGFLVIGGSSFNDKIEEDRQYGIKLMKSVGIQIPPTWDFEKLDDGIKFIQENPDRYVIKVDDSEAKYTSHIGKDAEDMISVITHMRDEGLVKSGFVLQKFVEGYEMSTEGHFNSNEFIPGLFIHTVEHKKFLTGDLGPTIGCAGSVAFGGKNLNKKLTDNLSKMTPILKKYKYKGAIDLNVIIDKEDSLWALEFCGRVGYTGLENFLDIFDGDYGCMLRDVAAGEGLDYKLSDDIGIGVVLTVPPFPVELEDHLSEDIKDEVMDVLGKRCYNIEVSGFEEFEDSCYFSAIKIDEDDKIRLTAKDGYIGAICARASSVDKCQTIVYDRLDKINLPSKQYRIDIGDRAKEWFKEKGRIIDDKKLSEDTLEYPKQAVNTLAEIQLEELSGKVTSQRFKRSYRANG